MEQTIVNSVHRIANAIYKKQGYMSTVNREDTRVVLQAYCLLINKFREENNIESVASTKS